MDLKRTDGEPCQQVVRGLLAGEASGRGRKGEKARKVFGYIELAEPGELIGLLRPGRFALTITRPSPAEQGPDAGWWPVDVGPGEIATLALSVERHW